jgi:hypothetical protein
LEAQKGALYRDVEIKIVDDRRPLQASEDPTRPSVVDGLYWLQGAAKGRDISIIFLSGHGIRDGKQNFWFLTRDADISRLRATAISNDDLLDLIAGFRGKWCVHRRLSRGAATPFIKATPSNVAADMNNFVNDFSAAGSGLVVYSASMGTELSHEDAKWDQHGAFAAALIETIGQGRVRSTRAGAMSISKGLVDDILKAPIEPILNAISSAASALWTGQEAFLDRSRPGNRSFRPSRISLLRRLSIALAKTRNQRADRLGVDPKPVIVDSQP